MHPRPVLRSVIGSSSRSLTTEVSADEYYQIFKQQKKRTEGDGDEDFSASSSSLSNSPSSKEHRMREILEKENSVPKRPKPEIKINGGELRIGKKKKKEERTHSLGPSSL
ncbi:Uncharacterized protein FKW44_017300 [Caligus rogercresseyi]|uniref:Uncharacterized protein n=1 Tax=Caligus rogercresseyi TaxID=217165 RepID=A0A7T8JW13_CALRO|nr:Uncharacterized protein FKW44_017300 [Caligus rogercresseyi]